MTPEAPMARRPNACPDPEQLAAYIDGGLPTEERTLVERHLVDCSECRDIIGGSVESLDEVREDLARQQNQGAAVQPQPIPFPSPPASKPPRAKWFIAGGGLLAAAAAVLLVVWLRQPSPHYVPEMADVVAAVGSSRPLEPRLTGGFGYGPPPEMTRGGTGSTVSVTVMAAAARVVTATANRTEPNAQAASGVASLLLGNPAAGIQALEEASHADGARPRILSDLAAAYLVRWKSGGTDVDLTRALDAAERATRLPNAPVEAWFNRALALEGLGPARARGGWQDYLTHDSSGPWADEAKRRLERLPRTSGRAQWPIDLERALARNALNDVDRLVQLRPA